MFLLKPKFIITLAIILGTLATYGAYRYLENQKEKMQKPTIKLQKVVTAKSNLSIGTQLEEHNLKVDEWLQETVPQGSFIDIKDLINRVVKIEVFAGEAILESKLAPEGSAGGFPSIIPPGMRALTVAVNVVSGVSGFILPNTHVDVLVTACPSSKKNETTTKIILEDIKVLAVDQTFQRKDDDPMAVQSVTVLGTPDQIEKLALACNEGKLQLSLRNDTDHELISTSGISLEQLIAKKATERVYRPKIRPTVKVKETPKPEPKPKVVEVIRANERSNVTFEEGESGKKTNFQKGIK